MEPDSEGGTPVQAAAPSVLTVEDDPTVRADLRLALEDAGYDVVHADGAEALELVRELQPDVIVLGRPAPEVTSERILVERRVPIVEVPSPFSSSQVVEAVTGAFVAHREREIRDTRRESLRSIESLVEHLSFATPPPADLEQESWSRGHVWRRTDSPGRDER
jgi:chemotaxis response regulator CheB